LSLLFPSGSALYKGGNPELVNSVPKFPAVPGTTFLNDFDTLTFSLKASVPDWFPLNFSSKNIREVPGTALRM